MYRTLILVLMFNFFHSIVTRMYTLNTASASDYDDYALIDDQVEHAKQKRSVSQVSVVYPEILVVVDHALFAKFNRSETNTKDYVVTFMSAVNQRFKSVRKPRVELNIADIRIGRTVADTPYLASNRVGKEDKFAAQGALDAMGRHFYQKTFPGVVYDIVLVLTSQEMCSYKGSKCSTSTAGYAYVGGACVSNTYRKKINSVGIVEDHGGYSGVIIAAHELGHLLGAPHDGQSAPAYVGGPGSASCRWSDGYIMSDMRRTERGWQWSRCSKTQMKHYLTSTSASCLRNQPHSFRYALVDLSSLSSRVPSLDEQCRMEVGTHSCFSDSRVCTQLFCADPKTGACISYRPAVEGSACNNGNGVCLNAKCSTSKTSLKVNKILGVKSTGQSMKTRLPAKSSGQSDQKCEDFRGKVDRGLTCNQLLRRFPYTYCKYTSLKDKCCKSVKKYC